MIAIEKKISSTIKKPLKNTNHSLSPIAKRIQKLLDLHEDDARFLKRLALLFLENYRINDNFLYEINQILDKKAENFNYFSKTTLENLNLSLRESQCLSYLMQGKSTKSIALALGLSVRTIEHYMNKLKIKMGVSFKSELIEKAFNEWKQ